MTCLHNSLMVLGILLAAPDMTSEQIEQIPKFSQSRSGTAIPKVHYKPDGVFVNNIACTGALQLQLQETFIAWSTRQTQPKTAPQT